MRVTGRILALAMLAACAGEIGAAPAAPDAAVASAPDAAGAVDAAVTTAKPCTRVAHIGDSLTAYTVGPLTSAYQAVGASAQIDAYGGRAVLQKLPADPKTGKQAAL